ncbi:MAG TPA: hypothetical protein VHV76_07520 [Mycobacteriales bacterium]|nr:hypothetical protein [Mycobacteriales bacterium]
MTIARFRAEGATVDVQARECFRQLRDFLDGLGQRLTGASSLVVEVADRRCLAPVMEARRYVFGDQKPPLISRRVTRLPAGERVRITVSTNGEDSI